METSAILGLVGTFAALALGIYNSRRAATKTEVDVLREQLKTCHSDRETLLTENRQLTRENVEYARRLLDDASESRTSRRRGK